MLLYTPFVEKRKNIDRTTLYSFKGLFELLHADIADIRFLAKSAVDAKYCLLFLDGFLFKIYPYPRGLLKKKIGKTRKNKEISKFAKKLEKKKSGLNSLQLEPIDFICDIARKEYFNK